jgi:hypothetical protein
MNDKLKPYFQPAFLVCVAVLAIAGIGKEAVIRWTGAVLTKEEIALRNPLEEISADKLGPYIIKQNTRIENDDIIEELGTKDYLQLVLEDSEADVDSGVKYCSFFVTYYTGDSKVTHVPEECYVGGGNRQLSSDAVVVKIKDQDDAGDDVESLPETLSVRHSVFSKGGDGLAISNVTQSVLYFFKVNGEFADSGQMTRGILGKNFFNKYAYFSKVEWKFFGANMAPATAEQSNKASGKLLRSILPVLEHEHWPDWEEINNK